MAQPVDDHPARHPGASPTDPVGLNLDAWQRRNEQRIHDALARLRQEPQGVLATTAWHDCFVVVTKGEERLRLWLMQSESPSTDWVQSEIDLADPLHLVVDYLQSMLLGLAWCPYPNRVLVSGLGGGALPLVLHHHVPELQLVCVEIAPPILQAATTFFPLHVDARMQLVLSDVADYLVTQPSNCFDMLFLDLFVDGGTTPQHLVSESFFRLCRERLRRGGILTMNLWTGAQDHAQRLDRLGHIFDNLYLCQVSEAIAVAFACDGARLDRADIIGRAISLQRQYRFRAPWVHWAARLE